MGNAIQFGIYKIIVACIFTLMVLSSFGQNDTIEFKSDKEKAWYQIEELYDNGAIVVRLKENKRKIDAYTNAGYLEKAEELRINQAAKNKEVIVAFSSMFRFCPVYFITAGDYTKVLNDIDSGYFLNEDLVIDSSIVMEEDFFFFCDHGAVYEQALLDQNDANSKYETSTPVQQDALVFKNNELNQLLDPFPFYVPVRMKGFIDAVENFNENLFDYYSKVQQKKAK